MTTIAIVPESARGADTSYRAVAGNRQSVGKTPGEALDGLTAQLPESESGTLLVVQQLRPDEFFPVDKQERLSELMNRWRDARDRGETLPQVDLHELEKLVSDEQRAAGQRAAALIQKIKP